LTMTIIVIVALNMRKILGTSAKKIMMLQKLFLRQKLLRLLAIIVQQTTKKTEELIVKDGNTKLLIAIQWSIAKAQIKLQRKEHEQAVKLATKANPANIITPNLPKLKENLLAKRLGMNTKTILIGMIITTTL